MTWLENVTWPKVVLLGGVILIITRMVAPDVADWILVPIVDLTRFVVNAVQTAIPG